MSERVHAREPLWAEVVEWLTDEAALLDAGKYSEWMTWLAPEMTYRMPVRENLARGAELGGRTYFHIDDDYEMLMVRTMRYHDVSAWAEDPPSRSRRFLSTIRVWRRADGDLDVVCSVLLIRHTNADKSSVTLSAERSDRLRQVDGGFQLVSRDVLLDQTTLGLNQLSVLF